MKKRNQAKNVKLFTYRMLTFFLFALALLNLGANLFAISQQYTFYYLGFNSVAIASRFIENTIYNIGFRVLLLGMTSLVASMIMYLLYFYAAKGRIVYIIIALLLYSADYSLTYLPNYLEGTHGIIISNFIQLSALTVMLFLIILNLFVHPKRRGLYDYA
jgi:hypothetical protein